MSTSGWSRLHCEDWRTPRDEREYLPLTGTVVAAHLGGRETVGLYPLPTDDTCHLVAVGLDKSTWHLDALAYVEAARVCQRRWRASRSGEVRMCGRSSPTDHRGGREVARCALLREAMALRGELDLNSNDRFFPSQESLPNRGFGDPDEHHAHVRPSGDQ